MKTSLFFIACAISTTIFAEANISSNWSTYGYIDGSYNYLLHSNQFTSGVLDRVYDINPDGVTLHQASFTLAYRPDNGLGGLINPIFGKDTFIFSPYGWNPDLGMQQAGFAIPQAYLQYAQNAFTLIGGTFNTLAGAEYLDPNQDTNFSRSILWGYAEPTTHLGIRSTYIMNKKLTLIAGVNNGWSNLRDTCRHKTLELSAVYTPNNVFSLALVSYSGSQRPISKTDFGPKSIRTLYDVVATFKLTEKLTLIGSYDYGVQAQAALPNDILGRAIWEGIAGYMNYQFNEKWRVSIRGEFFNDRDGYRTGVVQEWKEGTLTIGYAWLKNFELRAETRHDISNVNAFLNANGIGRSNNQQSYALEGVVKFS